MAKAAPQKLVQDVAPPRAPMNSAVTTQPQQHTQMPTAPMHPMFPVQAPVTPAARMTAEQPSMHYPTSQVTAPQQSSEVAQPQATPKPAQPTIHKPKINWFVIGLAIIVSAGLAYAAYVALKGA